MAEILWRSFPCMKVARCMRFTIAMKVADVCKV